MTPRHPGVAGSAAAPRADAGRPPRPAPADAGSASNRVFAAFALRRSLPVALAAGLAMGGCGDAGGSSGAGAAWPPEDALRPDVPAPVDALVFTDASCVAHREICNNLDDDCDGRVDDDDPDIERAVFDDPANCGRCGHVCRAEHTARAACGAGRCAVAACEAGFGDYNGLFDDGCESDCLVSAGGREVCDRSDNDCDGEVDEDFDLAADPQNCGECGVACPAVPHGTPGCRDRRCAVGACEAGWVDADGDPATGCEYRCTPRSTEAVREFCNGLDDDCDGQIDEPADLSPPAEDFCGQNGVCGFECADDADCGEAGSRCGEGHVCVPAGGPPQGRGCETDADCQRLHPGLACLADTALGPDGPVETRRCVERRHEPVCDGRAGYRCARPPAFREGPEVGACDGLDNNCDGHVDEAYAAALFVDGLRATEPRLCTAGEGACTQSGRVQCTADGQGTECSATALPPRREQDDDCNGRDDDCDGQTDEDFADAYVDLGPVQVYAYEASRPGATARGAGLDLVPDDGRDAYVEARACARPGVLPWANVTWAEAEAACRAAGARLCRRDEWTLACGGAGAEPYPYGVDYREEACNGGACDGDPAAAGDQDVGLPTGALAACQRAGIYDLSGNLKEWTDDEVDGLRPVRGGGYESNVPVALTCPATSDLKPEGFRSATLGFRCCRDR